MAERRRSEKAEKEEKEEKGRDEKEEKEEKGKEEKPRGWEEKGKTWDEKRRGGRVSAVVWAFILVWAGLVLLGENMRLFDFDWWNGWAVFFLGVGIIMLLGVGYRLLVPEHRRPVTGSVIFAVILLGIGLGGLVGWGMVGPVVLIAIALVVLIRAFARRR